MSKDNLKISRATHTRFKAFVKSLLKDDNVDGDVIHQMLESIRVNVSKELAGEFLMNLIQTIDDPDAEIVEASYWFGPVRVSYINAIFEEWYQYLDSEDMIGCATFNSKLYDKLDVSEEELDKMKKSALSQMIEFKWRGDKAQNKKTVSLIKQIHKWMKADIVKQEEKREKTRAWAPKPKSEPDPKPKKWWKS